MPKRASRIDLNTAAYQIVRATTGQEPAITEGKDPAAVELGRRGGLKGGKARAKKLSPKERSDIARRAADARWAARSD